LGGEFREELYCRAYEGRAVSLVRKVALGKDSNGILKSHYAWAAAVKKVLYDDRAGDAAETKPVLDVQRVISPPLEVNLVNDAKKVRRPP